MGYTLKNSTSWECFITAVIPLTEHLLTDKHCVKYFIATSNLWRKYHFPHFTDDESETQKLSNSPKVPQLGEDRATIQIEIRLMPKPQLLPAMLCICGQRNSMILESLCELGLFL